MNQVKSLETLNVPAFNRDEFPAGEAHPIHVGKKSIQALTGSGPYRLPQVIVPTSQETRAPIPMRIDYIEELRGHEDQFMGHKLVGELLDEPGVTVGLRTLPRGFMRAVWEDRVRRVENPNIPGSVRFFEPTTTKANS